MNIKVYVPSPKYAEIVGSDTAYYVAEKREIRTAYRIIAEILKNDSAESNYPPWIKNPRHGKKLRLMFEEEPKFSKNLMYALKVDPDGVVSVIDSDNFLAMIVCGNVEEKPC